MTARPDPTDAELAALVAAARARPDYQAALAREAADGGNPLASARRAWAIQAIYRELLVAGGWLEGDGAVAVQS